MSKLLAKTGLKINAGELDVLQNLLRDNARNAITALIHSPGLIIGRDSNDNLELDWKVYDAGSATIGIRAGVAINELNQYIEIIADLVDTDITNNPLPDDSTDYNINIGYATREKQLGTISVAGSDNTVIGVGTEFTKYLTAGMKFIILPGDTAQGNDGTFTVISVTNDTSLEVAGTPFTTENTIEFSVVGTFATGYPTGNTNIIENDYYLVTIETAAPGAGEYTLAVVSNTGGTLTITDKRVGSLLSSKPLKKLPGTPKIPLDQTITTGIMGYIKTLRHRHSIGPFGQLLYADTYDLVPSGGWILVKWGKTGSGSWSNSVFTPDIGGMTIDIHIGETITYGGADYTVTDNDATTVTVSSGPTSGSGTYVLGPNAKQYDVSISQLDSSDDLIDDTEELYKVEFIDPPTNMYKRFENLEIGVKYRIKVRSNNGEGADQKSGWTAIIDTVAGIQEPLVMNKIKVVAIDNGVRVSHPSVELAAAYEGVYTLDGSTPDRFNTLHRRIAASNGNLHNIVAPPRSEVKVTMWCLDQAGQMSSNTVTDGTIAGGISIGSNEKVLEYVTKSLTATDDEIAENFIGRKRIYNPMVVKEVIAYIENLNLNSAAQGLVRIYMDGAEDNAAVVTFTVNGPAVITPNLVVDQAPGFLIADGYDSGESANTTGQAAFDVEVFVVYREDDALLKENKDQQ